LLYNSNGQIKITTVTGSSYTGLYAADGSWNVVINDGSAYKGLYHPCGAYNAVVTTNPHDSSLAKNGSLNICLNISGGYSPVEPNGTPPPSPADFSPTLWIEPAKSTMYQSSAGTTPATANGNVVGYITDLSGNNNYYTSQADDTTRPTLQGIGTKPVLRFDGSNDFLMKTGNLGLLSNGTYTLAFTFKSNNAAVDSRLFAGGNSLSNNTLFIPLQASNPTATSVSGLYRNDAGVQLVNPSTITNPNVFDNNNHVFILTDDGTFIKTYVDGVTGAATGWTPSGTFTIDRSAIGCLLRGASGNWWAGDIYGIVAIKRVLNQYERQRLTTYMGSLAGLTL
jgi:hypothetical protein